MSAAVRRDAYLWAHLLQFLTSHAAEIRAEVAPMSKLFAGFLVIASMLALSAFGLLGLVVATRLINFLP